MITQTTVVREGKIVLPRDAKKSWNNARVFVAVDGDAVSVVRLAVPRRSLGDMVKEVRAVVKSTGVRQREVREELRSMRAL